MLVNYEKFTNYIAIAVCSSIIKQILQKRDCGMCVFFVGTSKRH